MWISAIVASSESRRVTSVHRAGRSGSLRGQSANQLTRIPPRSRILWSPNAASTAAPTSNPPTGSSTPQTWFAQRPEKWAVKESNLQP